MELFVQLSQLGLGLRMGSMPSWEIAGLCAMGAAATALICWFAAPLGRTIGVMDEPDGARKLHHRETPLMGGPAILVPALAITLFYYTNLSLKPIMLVALLAAVLAFVVGLIDDRSELSPTVRVGLLTSVIVAALVFDPLLILHTLSFTIFKVTFAVALPNLIAGPFVVLMILGFVNAANMADGMNGQLLGSAMLWSAFILRYIGLDAGLPFLFVICCCAVAFVFNLQGRLFTGSSGAYAISLLVAFGAIAAYRLADGLMPAQEPVYWFWLPVLDCVRLMISRALKGRSPFAADRRHFHHLLLEYMQTSRALLIYLVLLSAPGIAAMVNQETASVTLVVCILLYSAFIVIHQLGAIRDAQADTKSHWASSKLSEF